MAIRTMRVGFDFDGVIAYNPLRVLRMPAMAIRRLIMPNHQLRFPVPKEKTWRFLWNIAHETSFFPAYGFSELRKLLEEKKIEGYIVTGRYSFLEKSLHNWLKKHGVEGLFKEIHLNKKNEQPHLFKERMLQKLNLDYFVEDNWDIVNYLHRRSQIADRRLDNVNKKKSIIKHPASAKASVGRQSSIINPTTEIHWIYNIIDRFQRYPNKHPHLKGFLQKITEKQRDIR